MIVIVCLDENQGMMFHGRRQSRDKAVSERIEQICKGKKLWMNSYSYQLYGTLEGAVEDEEFIHKAGSGEFCLVENQHLSMVQKKLEELIIFWWNRSYPRDFRLDLDLSEWRKRAVREFPGNSHEKITEVCYRPVIK